MASNTEKLSNAIDTRLYQILTKGRRVWDREMGEVMVDASAADIKIAMERLEQCGWMAPEKPTGRMQHMSSVIARIQAEAPERMRSDLMADNATGGEYEEQTETA